MQSYSLDIEAKVLTDRKNRGVSDTYNRPGAELTMEAVHESGLVGYLQLGTVRKEIFPDTNGLQVTGALGYRWGKSDGWHFGVGAAQEWFPGAKVNDAPTGIDWTTGQPTGLTNTKFDTTYAIFEFAYGVVEARYLYVASRDLRGNNTAIICGSTYMLSRAGRRRPVQGHRLLWRQLPQFARFAAARRKRRAQAHRTNQIGRAYRLPEDAPLPRRRPVRLQVRRGAHALGARLRRRSGRQRACATTNWPSFSTATATARR
ncbi:hypothetical protein LP419_06585 [Massilia sp. H-1]|nr:hypothetical protein LP419_06585 [Massilia sp. H-1]